LGVEPGIGQDDPGGELARKIQSQQQRELAASQKLLDELKLTRGQARRLLPILDKAGALYIESYDREAKLLPELHSALTALAAEDRLNRGFTPTVERRAGQLGREEKELREAATEELAELERQAARILTSAQRQAIGLPARGTDKPGLPGDGARSVSGGQPPDDAAELERWRLGVLRAELDALNARKHRQLGRLGRQLLVPAAFESVCRLAGTGLSPTLLEAVEVYQTGRPDSPLQRVQQQREEVRRLRKEINNWNLINGLYLDQDQIQRIVSLYQAAVGDLERPRRLSKAELVELERSIEQLLNPGQLQVLAEYKACLIPPKNLKDPVRVGQANDDSAYERWLERSRRLTGPALDRAIDQVLQQESERLGELSRAERQKRAALLGRTVRRAAAMSDVEFEISKSELAARLTPPDRVGELRAEIERLARALGEPGRLSRFMLNPEFIGQLRQRGEQLVAGPERRSADLAAGPQAENCEKGCAIKPRGAAQKPPER